MFYNTYYTTLITGISAPPLVAERSQHNKGWGFIQNEAKQALEKLKEWYQAGYIHPDFAQDHHSREVFQKIYGVGPKKANDLIKLGFNSINDLQKSDKLSELLNEKQLLGLKYYKDINTRIPRDEIEVHEDILKDVMATIDVGGDVTIAGSYRRGKPDSGDIDVLITSENQSIFR